MEPSFWQGRWDNQQIGFHEGAPNRFLVRFEDELGLSDAGSRVLVPLCGKSHDLDHLARRAGAVVGVELVERAVLDFFAERGLAPDARTVGQHVLRTHGPLTLVCGDFFAYRSAAPFDAVWDRAALIALPPELRARYATHLAGLVAPGGRVLLVTIEHDAAQGPPFSVDAAEVAARYGAAFEIRELASEDVTQENAHIVAKGATFVRERCYALAKR